MSDIYCGIGKVPKNKVMGTANECINNGQIRYWGIEKIDKKLLNSPNLKKVETDIRLTGTMINGYAKRFKREKEAYNNKKEKYENTTDKVILKDLAKKKKDLDKLRKLHDTAVDKHRELKKLAAKIREESQ